MKRFVICLAAIGLIFSFNACKKDGVYNPSKKVSKIYTEVYLYDSVYNVIGSVPMLSQNFTWDKNILKEVDSYREGEQRDKEIFVYDGKRLVRIDHVDPDYISDIEEQTIFSYEGSKLHKATILDNGDIEAEIEYIYDKNKISEMIYTMYSSGLSLNILEPLKQVLDPNMVEVLSCDKEMLACLEAKNGLTHKAGVRTMKIELEWERDNISQVKLIQDSYTQIVSFTYDNKKNPFYSRPMEDIETMGDPEYGLLSFFCNKNNIVQMESTSSGHTYTIPIEYEYDGSYPIKQTITPPHADPDDIVVKYIEYR